MTSRNAFVQAIVCLALTATMALGISGCKKEGIGGNAEVAFHVKHHETVIPFAKVYIKYGTKEFPGTDLSLYDDSTLTDAEAHGHFHGLVKGDYYVYGVGYDSSISDVVVGGIPVQLKAKQVLEIDVPVTE